MFNKINFRNVQSYNLNLDEYRIYGKISDTTYGMVRL